MSPNDLACELFLRELGKITPAKDKHIKEIARRSCEVADIFYDTLVAYARSKPQPPPPPEEASSGEPEVVRGAH